MRKGLFIILAALSVGVAAQEKTFERPRQILPLPYPHPIKELCVYKIYHLYKTICDENKCEKSDLVERKLIFDGEYCHHWLPPEIDPPGINW